MRPIRNHSACDDSHEMFASVTLTKETRCEWTVSLFCKPPILDWARDYRNRHRQLLKLLVQQGLYKQFFGTGHQPVFTTIYIELLRVDGEVIRAAQGAMY
jgi:hypothetical protein